MRRLDEQHRKFKTLKLFRTGKEELIKLVRWVIFYEPVDIFKEEKVHKEKNKFKSILTWGRTLIGGN